MQQCVTKPPQCNAMTCAGCCDAADQCQAGFLDTQCGENGVACTDCSATGGTCDTSANPRVCAMQVCPAPYPGCGGGVTTQPIPVQPGLCPAGDLANAASACSGGATTPGCVNFFNFEKTQHPACAQCLFPFEFDFQAVQGLANCAAPFLSPSCNHSTACVGDCETLSCQLCPAGQVNSCEQATLNGQCQQLVGPALMCLFSGAQGTFCDPTLYGANYGKWLQGVGAHYCQ
jgi:hypothetical protein